MQHIFIAIGGSGTKAAEALVRLLALGFPTRVNQPDMLPTSAGDSLQIWRLDPDRSSGAAQALQKAVKDYTALQNHLRKGEAPSQWALEIEPEVRHLDPLALSAENQRVKSLRGILNSQGRALSGEIAQDTQPFLDLFYEPRELDVEIDRGFYQKPFIGAPVMAIFAEQLKDPNSAGGSQCQLNYLQNKPVRFFLCGSLHGGTGACGVPVMGRFIGEHKRAMPHLDWQLGGCLLAPYSLPPAPPFEQLTDARQFSPQLVNTYVQQYGDVAPFSSLATPEQKRELARQILLGFYAHPEDMTERARHSLVYYKEHITPHFNALYLVGKPVPDQLKDWSNGGETQQNPLNATEVTAALAALNFFAGMHDREHDPQSYWIGAGTRTLAERMFLHDLPRYALPTREKAVGIDPEKVLLATAALRHLIKHQLPWAYPAGKWPNEYRLKEFYRARPEREVEDRAAFAEALQILTESLEALLSPKQTLGWNGGDYTQLEPLLSDDSGTVAELTQRLKHRSFFVSGQPEGLAVGQSEIKLTAKEFSGWCPASDGLARGEYLRFVWAQLLNKAYSASRAIA